MLDFLNHGPLMDEAGDTGGGGVDTGGGESTALITTGDADIATTDTDTTDDTTGTELATQETEAPFVNGRPSKATSTALQTISKTHPQLARQIPRDIAVAARLRSQFPGQNPFDAIKALERRIKDLGGEEGIREMQATVQDVRELDALYAKSDPRMFDRMTETPEGKASFIQLAPHAIALFEKLAPKAFTKYMAGVINGDLIGNRVDMTIQRIAEMTPKELAGADGAKVANPVVAELAKLQAYFTRLGEMEKLAPEVIEVKANTEDQDLVRQRQELAREKAEIKAQNWKSSADSAKNRIYTDAWEKESKGKKISAVDREDIQARIAARLPLALKQIPGFSDTLKGFFEADDKDGYLRYLNGKHAEHIPRITKAEIQRRYGTSATTATPKDKTETTTADTKVDQGFRLVNAVPEANTVDTRRTTRDMISKNQAILKSGQKVQWR